MHMLLRILDWHPLLQQIAKGLASTFQNALFVIPENNSLDRVNKQKSYGTHIRTQAKFILILTESMRLLAFAHIARGYKADVISCLISILFGKLCFPFYFLKRKLKWLLWSHKSLSRLGHSLHHKDFDEHEKRKWKQSKSQNLDDLNLRGKKTYLWKSLPIL